MHDASCTRVWVLFLLFTGGPVGSGNGFCDCRGSGSGRGRSGFGLMVVPFCVSPFGTCSDGGSGL